MLALPVINHLIQQNPETQHALAGYNGIVLTLNIAGLRVHGQFNAQGFLEASEREADTVLTFHASAMQKLMQKQMPGVGDFDIGGNQELGFNLLPLIGSLRYDASDDLARLFGNAAAGSIASRAEKVGHTLKQIGQSLMDQAAESHQPITITGKRHDAVLLSAEDWQAIQETLYLLSVPGMRESIKEGMAESTESCAKELDW